MNARSAGAGMLSPIISGMIIWMMRFYWAFIARIAVIIKRCEICKK